MCLGTVLINKPVSLFFVTRETPNQSISDSEHHQTLHPKHNSIESFLGCLRVPSQQTALDIHHTDSISRATRALVFQRKRPKKRAQKPVSLKKKKKKNGVETTTISTRSKIRERSSTKIGSREGEEEENASTTTRSTTRSEERRVGKECRSRWSPYH